KIEFYSVINRAASVACLFSYAWSATVQTNESSSSTLPPYLKTSLHGSAHGHSSNAVLLRPRLFLYVSSKPTLALYLLLIVLLKRGCHCVSERVSGHPVQLYKLHLMRRLPGPVSSRADRNAPNSTPLFILKRR